MSEHIDRVVAAVDRVLESAAPAVDDDSRPASAEQQAQNWQETARQYSQNADYWRERFAQADNERADWKRWCEDSERRAAERDALASIVRDLAALECPVETIVSEVTGDRDGLCPACDATLRSDCIEVEPHEDGCVWLRACEWVARQEAE